MPSPRMLRRQIVEGIATGVGHAMLKRLRVETGEIGDITATPDVITAATRA